MWFFTAFNIIMISKHVRFLILTKLVLVLLLSSSGMGRNTAKAIQLAKMVSKMMISKVLDGKAQDHNNTRGQNNIYLEQ